MKFLFASDSFKGSLSSQKTAELLAKAAREIFPDCQCDSIVVADSTCGYKWKKITCASSWTSLGGYYK